jgi:hypothetical protein
MILITYLILLYYLFIIDYPNSQLVLNDQSFLFIVHPGGRQKSNVYPDGQIAS